MDDSPWCYLDAVGRAKGVGLCRRGTKKGEGRTRRKSCNCCASTVKTIELIRRCIKGDDIMHGS